MSDDLAQLQCTIHGSSPNGTLIEADVGQNWFAPDEFEVIKRAHSLEDVDGIRISLALAVARGIT